MNRFRSFLVFLPIFIPSLALAEPVESVPAADSQPTPAIEGFCPVALMDDHTWTKGSEDHAVTIDGHRYLLTSADARSKFLGSPNRYVPALHGDCPVRYLTAGVRESGGLKYTVFFSGRMFVLSDGEAKKTFARDPQTYADADLAFDGDCSVCLIDAKIRKPGGTQFMTHHNGLRYLFPNQILVDRFRANPARYVDSSQPKPPSEMMGAVRHNVAKPKLPVDRTMSSKERVRVTGRSACALCEFGISPLRAPDELGMAVYSADGTVYIVEDAHEKYPKIYLDREADQSVTLTGKVIKKEDNVVWVEPDTVSVLK